MKVIISDTTALIILAKTNHLDLLTNLIEKVYVPKAVMHWVVNSSTNLNLNTNIFFMPINGALGNAPYRIPNE